MLRVNGLRKLGLETLESRDTPAALSAVGVAHAQPLSLGATFLSASASLEKTTGLKLRAVTVGGVPGATVVLEATLSGGTNQQIKGKTITFAVNGRHYTATTDPSGHATVRYTIPKTATVQSKIIYTVHFGNMISSGQIKVR